MSKPLQSDRGGDRPRAPSRPARTVSSAAPDGTRALTQVGAITVEHFAEVMLEITDVLVEDVDPIEFLTLVTTRTASMGQSLWAGVLLADPEGRFHLAAASTENAAWTESAALTELVELLQAEGHWLDRVRNATLVANIDLTRAAGRWPVLVPRALSAGFHAVSAFPLRGRPAVIGALILFSSDPAHLAPADVRILQALADITTIGLLPGHDPHDLHDPQDPQDPQDGADAAADFQSSLTNRIAAEQAKGALAKTRGVSVEAASDLIDGYAHRTRQHPDRVAEAVLADPDLLTPAGPRALLTPAEVAAMFRVDPKTITRWAKTGQLNAVRTLGGHRRYRHSDVARLLTES